MIHGVMLDSSLSFDNHVNAVVRACNYNLRSLRYIRHSVTRDIANTLACSIAGSRIDYCNALNIYGVSGKNIDRLQRLQNGLARVVCDIGVRKLHNSGLNSMLHWLPIRTRIEFNVVTLCYKLYRLGTPSYLASNLQPYLPFRMLRSSNLDQITVSASRIKLTSRNFSACAPSLWITLPASLRAAEIVSVFKSHLKTHLYRQSLM